MRARVLCDQKQAQKMNFPRIYWAGITFAQQVAISCYSLCTLIIKKQHATHMIQQVDLFSYYN